MPYYSHLDARCTKYPEELSSNERVLAENKVLLILSIILYTALVKLKPKCVGMLMKTTNNCCINCDRQTAYCHTPINWHTVKQRQADRQSTYRHTHTVLCGMPVKSVKYPTCSDACYTVKSNLIVTFHRKKYPTLSVLTMITCHKFSPSF